MAKRTPAFDPAQMAFGFEPNIVRSSDGMFAGVDRQIASSVARILKDDERDRYDVAAAMSRLMDADVSKSMLDKYASESSEEHNISAGRWLVLIGATRRYDVFTHFAGRLGCGVVLGEEMLTVELGNAIAEKERIEERIRHLKKAAPMIKRGKSE
jgi:hypothetical protein